jgi:hypothetical protein
MSDGLTIRTEYTKQDLVKDCMIAAATGLTWAGPIDPVPTDGPTSQAFEQINDRD